MIPAEPTLANVAQQIVEGRATDNLQFLVIFMVLLAVAGIVIYFIAPYLSERGKLLAAAETLGNRLEEIRQTTAAAERIRTEIAYSDWTVKENKTLRRTKLEHALTAAYKVLLTCEADVRLQNTDTTDLTSREFLIELKQLSAFYFPEMAVETKAVVEAHRLFAVWIIEGRTKMREAKAKVTYERAQLDLVQSTLSGVINGINRDTQRERLKQANDEVNRATLAYADGYLPFNRALRDAIDNLEARAVSLMSELIAPATTS